MKKINVLFLCTGNTARSQMAEAFLRKYAGDRFAPHSAGLTPGEINPYALRVMAEKGIDMDGQYSKPFSVYMGRRHFGYLIVVCEEAEKKCPTTFPDVSNRLFWRFEDPAAFRGDEAETMEKFREVRDRIEARIKAWLAEQGGRGAGGQ